MRSSSRVQARDLRVGIEAHIYLGAPPDGRPVKRTQPENLLLSRLVAVDEKGLSEPLCLHTGLELRGARSELVAVHRLGLATVEQAQMPGEQPVEGLDALVDFPHVFVLVEDQANPGKGRPVALWPSFQLRACLKYLVWEGFRAWGRSGRHG